MEIKTHLLPPITLSCTLILLLSTSTLCDQGSNTNNQDYHGPTSSHEAHTQTSTFQPQEQPKNPAEHPDVCLSPDSAPTASANPSAELQSLIKVSTEKTKTAMELVKKKRAKPTLPPMVAANLKVCEDSYDDALDNLAKATKAMDAQDMPTLNVMLSAALTNYDTCEIGFVEMPGISPMADEDETLSQLMKNSLEVYQLMKG
ncbi:hypothetical protein MRB53_029025 [Persea americana]|uniref:Uncharacterized protein n=1 Tax=Persea americana TaxID=3435 RepID=A0ACC2KHK5_PERAE|nr:hypothetical protein MRB53_029025 [Persea americana]